MNIKPYKTYVINTIFTILVVFIMLYVGDKIFYYINLENASSRLALKSKSPCDNKDKLVEIHGISMPYRDGGFRNQAYTELKEDYLQVWADTMCLNKNTYTNKKNLKKVSAFQNKTYKINPYGYRGDDWTEPLQDNVKRVFLVGGSVAFSLHTNESDSIHSLLEYKLNQKSLGDNEYQVFNAAIPGASAVNEYNVFVRDIIKYSPDVIIFLTGINNAGRAEVDDYSTYRVAAKVDLFLSILEGFFGIFGFDNLHYTMQSINSFEKISSRDSLLKYELKSNSFCKKYNIRCIFALQPTLLVERYILSDTERKIKYYVFNYQKGIDPYKYESDYGSFDKMFRKKENEFEYVNLTDIGSLGLYGGWIQPAQSISLPKNLSRISMQFKVPQGLQESSEELKINSKKYFIGSCENKFFEITSVNQYRSLCEAKFFDKLSALTDSSSIYEGYEKLLSKDSDNVPVIFKFYKKPGLNSIEISLKMKNYRNRDDFKVAASISYDGISYIKPVELEKGYLDGEFSLQWDIDKLHNSNAIYVALDYASSSQIGIDSLKYEMKGKIPNFKLSEPLKIENISNAPLLLTQKHDDSDEVFVDAAHLTDFGNMLVSEKIANQILGH